MHFDGISGSNYLTFVISLAGCARSVMGDCGITLSQYRFLSAVEAQGGIARTGDLGTRLDFSPSTVSSISSDLEKGGFIARKDGFEDSRVVKVAISARGKELVAMGDQAIADSMSDFLSPARAGVDAVSQDAKLRYIEKYGMGRGLEFWTDLSCSRIESMITCEKRLQKTCITRGLTTLEYRMLLLLHEKPSVEKLSDLARLLLVRQANLSVAVRSLKKSGSVIRGRKGLDRRCSFLEMTAEGYRVFQQVDRDVESFLVAHTSGFSADELAQSWSVMDTCVRSLQEAYRTV